MDSLTEDSRPTEVGRKKGKGVETTSNREVEEVVVEEEAGVPIGALSSSLLRQLVQTRAEWSSVALDLDSCLHRLVAAEDSAPEADTAEVTVSEATASEVVASEAAAVTDLLLEDQGSEVSMGTEDSEDLAYGVCRDTEDSSTIGENQHPHLLQHQIETLCFPYTIPKPRSTVGIDLVFKLLHPILFILALPPKHSRVTSDCSIPSSIPLSFID